MKKIRKNRRKADQQDKQDRIRMGLIPPDPPKGLFYCIVETLPRHLPFLLVRLANLMKVLTSDAVQDPTKVEARVRREVAMRKLTHDRMNDERKLTDEQKREKIETKKVEEEKKGLYGAVYKYVYSISHNTISPTNLILLPQSENTQRSFASLQGPQERRTAWTYRHDHIQPEFQCRRCGGLRKIHQAV